MDIREALFGGWAMFIMLGFPIAVFVNLLMALAVAGWLTKRPRWSLGKAVLIWGAVFVVALLLQWRAVVHTLSDPGWATRAAALSAVVDMWASWILKSVLFGLFPQVGALIWSRLFLRRKNIAVLNTQPLFSMILCALALFIYVAGAMALLATPD